MEEADAEKNFGKMSDLPPSGTSLHKRRRGEPPASLSVKTSQSSDAEFSSPCTAPTPDDYWTSPYGETDPEHFCETMLQRLKDQNDPISTCGKNAAEDTKEAIKALDQLEKALQLLSEFIKLKERNESILRRLRDVEQLKKMLDVRKRIAEELEQVKTEDQEVKMMNEVLDSVIGLEYSQAILENIIHGAKMMKRSGSKWRNHSRFGGSLLRKQRSRSAGGDDSDVQPGTPLRRRSEGLFAKEVDKTKVSKWRKVKAAFRWEKAQWQPTISMGGAAGAVAAGALVGAVALAGSAPASATSTLTSQGELRETSLTPRSTISLSPNSSCEELRMEPGYRKSTGIRSDDNDNVFLQAPTQDDSSASPSPNKMHKNPWSKMKDIIQTKRESVRKKTRNKSSPDVVPMRRRSLSDGGDSDAPPALTLTIPSSEELESDPHPVLRKQRSLELAARPPQHRPPRASKWTKVKRAFLPLASASVPSSPNRHSAFFTDPETEALSSGCEASGVKEEIARDFAALQSRLTRELSDRRDKLHSATRPVATEEQLSPDFRKKLAEWQRIKGVKQPPPMPARHDLSDDFLKKWDAWKHMKETNSVPAWEEEAKRDEVLVQTSTGLYKFQGISRSFTRKLHEWEKSRGIAPEASTSALLRAAKSRVTRVPPAAPLTRTQSDGSVAPSVTGSRRHASSLSVNDAEDFDLEYNRQHHYMETTEDVTDGENTRAAVLVEVEAEEICTASPLFAMTPQHTPQKPIYTYGRAEARLLCETSSAITGTAVIQPSGGPRETKSKDKTNGSTRDQTKSTQKSSRRKVGRQPSIEEDAQFIRKTIAEVERGSSSRQKNGSDDTSEAVAKYADYAVEKYIEEVVASQEEKKEDNDRDDVKEDRRKEGDKSNGKKKSKSRARLERELSKPSESDTELDVDTVTVEIPRRRKRPRRPSERPKTPPTSVHSDSEGEIFVLKLQAPEPREGSPEVIVKTTRKIFSPVVRCGETVPRAVIPLDVEDLEEEHRKTEHSSTKEEKKEEKTKDVELQEDERKSSKSRPPLPLSPLTQKKHQPKETSPSIRIMIQRYNKKIHEDGHTSGQSSGASSPAWRSPAAERRRPPDMPVGVNIRNNPFLEREVQKSASACQLSRQHPTSDKPPPTLEGLECVLKSLSANALHIEKQEPTPEEKKEEKMPDDNVTTSTDTLAPDLTKNLPVFTNLPKCSTQSVPNFARQTSYTPPVLPENLNIFERSVSVVEPPVSLRVSERTARIREAREKFLTNAVNMRKDGTSSAHDLRPGDRHSQISCESDVTESHSRCHRTDSNLGRSASTGMVNVERDTWERVAEGRRNGRPAKSRFSLARLAAKLRKKDGGAVSKLCRQSLLVEVRNKQ